MRLNLTAVKLEAHAGKTKTLPSFFSEVHMKYFLYGEDEPEKFIKTVVLSMTKYCGVSYMISKACPIGFEVHLNDQLIHEDQAKFTLEVIENG
jgi:putative redox protein